MTKLKVLLLLTLLSIPRPACAKPSVVNDVTQLNPVLVDREERPTTAEEVQKFISEWKGPVSIGGGRFSMGGQTASEHTLHLDMRQMDKVLDFSKEEKWIRVQPGITWRKIQSHVDPHNLSVKIMQSYSNFTVGGSLSVNVHGRYMGLGPLVMSVRSIKIVLADGKLMYASPTENSDLFYGAIGGYGGLGVIVEATLDLADNVKMEREVKALSMPEYKKYFFETIRDDKKVIFHNGDIYPPQWNKVNSVSWIETTKDVTVKDRLMPPNRAGWLDRAMLFGMTEVPFGKELRASVLEPMRNQAKPVVWRNYEASYDVGSLEPSSRTKSTYVLEEYFVPVDQLENFSKKMGAIFDRHKANILNVSIRHALKDPGVIMAWSREECFAFVIYYKQGTSKEAQLKVGQWTRELIDLAISLGGTYYLPYQLHATEEQFKKAYPASERYFELKLKLDPQYRFRNKLWDKYYKPKEKPVTKRPEEQTYLTLPEWYVVYAADELGAHLGQAPPSAFPFFHSIFQFWGLEKDVIRATSGKYPFNFGYHVMIAVVGISHSVEFFIRGLYEKTIGRLSESIGGTDSGEDRFLRDVAVDYGKFIHNIPWYEYPFRQKLSDFWKIPASGSRFRRWERSFAGSMELGGKAAWSWVIKKATAATYEPEDLTIEVLVKKPEREIKISPEVKLFDTADKFTQRLVVPRYEAFTRIARELALQGLPFLEIGGNRKIVLTLITPDSWKLPESDGELVREWPILTQPGQKRVALATDVERLHLLIPAWEANKLVIDHIYDY